MRYFQDIEVGTRREFGEWTLTEDEIVEFAEQWDPQRFHTDPDAAAESVHGGLIASGLHTIGVAMRMLVEEFLNDSANRGGLGMDDMTWHRPVRPGDVLRVRHEVVERRDTESYADAGVVVRDVEVMNDADEVVASWTTAILMGKREAD